MRRARNSEDSAVHDLSGSVQKASPVQITSSHPPRNMHTCMSPSQIRAKLLHSYVYCPPDANGTSCPACRVPCGDGHRVSLLCGVQIVRIW